MLLMKVSVTWVLFLESPEKLQAPKSICKTLTYLFCKARLFICCKGMEN